MRDEILRFCRSEELFAAGDRVVCAVSGGADSMALLWSLYTMRRELQLTLEAAHFNHRLRGAESDRDERFVRDFCSAHAIPLTVGSADVAACARKNGRSVETEAREQRYAFLLSLPCDKLATAHNADDNAETVLLHLLRGSGLHGLTGIPPKRGRVVRPLLSVTRGQIEAFLRGEGIAWVEDSTNASDDCRRNRLRHRVIPLLKAEAPTLTERLTAQSALLRSEDAYLDEMASQCLARAEQGSGWSCAALSAASAVLQRRALRLLLRRFLPQDVASAHIEALRGLLVSASPSARVSLPGGLLAERRYELLTIVRSRAVTFPKTVLTVPGRTAIPELGLTVTAELQENFVFFKNTPFHFAVKYDMITQSTIEIRPRRRGDALLLENGHTRSLKELFIDRKLPRSERELVPILATELAVLAAAGVAVNCAFRAEAGQPALIIQIKKEEM